MKYKATLEDVVCSAHAMSIGGVLVFWKPEPDGATLSYMRPDKDDAAFEPIHFDPTQQVVVQDGELTFTAQDGKQYVLTVYQCISLTPQCIRDTVGAIVEQLPD
jgi:hypothetical protein